MVDSWIAVNSPLLVCMAVTKSSISAIAARAAMWRPAGYPGNNEGANYSLGRRGCRDQRMDGVRCGQDGPPTCAAEREWPPTKADQKQGVPVVYNLRNSTYSPKTELSPVSREILKRR